MNEYNIKLSALSSKSVKVLAKNSKEALSLAHKIYIKTNILDFNDSDVEGIITEITNCDEVVADDYFDKDTVCENKKCCSVKPNRRRQVE